MDLTPAGDVKIPVVEEYARALASDVLLLHVVRTVAPDLVLRSEAVGRTYLDTVAARLRSAGIEAQSVLRTGPAGAVIVEEALVRDVMLIILGANIRPTLHTAVLGSVADQVVRSAPCPVLLVQPRGETRPRTMLRCFDEDAERAGVLIARSLGLRTIEVVRIVGSVGRCKELGPDFRPPRRRRRKVDEDRFRRLLQAVEGGLELPPIEVRKLGFGYYVLDGHHRVGLALARGQLEIDAHVTEYVPAADEQSAERFAARRTFELATGLTDVGAARAESYAQLREAIERFGRDQGMNELPLAARRWFADVFRPLWENIRAREVIARLFPGDRTADVIARIVAGQCVGGSGLSWQDALDRFLADQVPPGASSTSSRNG